MSGREFKKYLRQFLRQETELEKEQDKEAVNKGGEVAKCNDARMEETVKLCTEWMREQKLAQKAQEEPRTGFARYLSDIFRFEGTSVFGLQAVALFILCLAISATADIPQYIPSFMPLFVLAIMPVMCKCQYYGMSEMEAATRASGSQIVLAKLILIGAANLVCMTVLILFARHLPNVYGEMGRMILYCIVPYLVCMAGMLRLLRLRGKESIPTGIVFVLGSCVSWGMLARTLPWLYEASAFGIWIVAFLFFAAFFIREIGFIIIMRKEGKIYGVIN